MRTLIRYLLFLLLLRRGRAYEEGYSDTGTCSSNCSVSRMLIQVFLSSGMIEKCSVVYSKRHYSTPSVTTNVSREFIKSSEGQVWKKQGLTRVAQMVDRQSQELGYNGGERNVHACSNRHMTTVILGMLHMYGHSQNRGGLGLGNP